MRIVSFKNWSIFGKFMSLSLLMWLVLVLTSVLVLSPYIRSLIMHEKQAALRCLVEEASATLVGFQQQAESGALTREEAQRRAATAIKALRYGGKEYFWINDLQARLIAHPLRPESEGKEMGSFKDADGRPIYLEFAKTAGLRVEKASWSTGRSNRARIPPCRSSPT